ncbi:MFS transporter [Pikeienuella piscinae]|uniref:MFS transporter n=1 Tax=Pikeienuella piscinae TaxID=2748098 RepID=A0A7L5BY24_9RHOB|nr:MFS transporter [Pikeienuella piscinae]QIE55417.1 MFS transporter [Pikeienuella piscinae]
MSMGARLRSALLLSLVAALSLALLVFVGWGEAKRTYPKFIFDKLAAQGEIVQSAMDGHLRAGLPVGEFPGFRRIAEPIRVADPTVAAIVVRGADGAAVFSVGEAAVPRPPGPEADARFALSQQDGWVQVALAMRNRFERVGQLEVTMARAVIDARIDAMLPALIALAGGLVLAFGGFAFWAAPRAARGGLAARTVGVYGLVFVIAATAVAASLVSLYAEGAQAKAEAISDSLAQRIRPLLDYGLTLDDVDGLDRVLADYERRNSDIAAVGLMRDGLVSVHTDPAMMGAPWRAAPGAYEFIVKVNPAGAGEEIQVGVALPAEVVWKAVGRSVKNFAALLLASGFFAAVFLNVARSLGGGATSAGARMLTLMRPIFFVAIFADFLSAGFLPQLLRDEAAALGLGQSATSLAFTAYFATFVAALLPASVWVERRGPRAPVVTGAVLVAAAGALPALTMEFQTLVASRALAGIGQGLLLIGVQSAILANASARERTRATAIIVIGFNGGMISGAAIGSLLVDDLTAEGVFALSSLAALLLALYAARLIRGGAPEGEGAASFVGLLRHGARAIGSFGFMRAFLLVGAPAKAVLTGVIVFAAPLFLSNQGWTAEDIGQIIMLYASGVLLSTGAASRHVDRTGDSRGVLMLGGVGSALGLAMIGGSSFAGLAPPVEFAIAAGGVFITGLAHGCVNAPIVSHIGDTDAAEKLGRPAATAIYRLMERIGHVAGPVLVGLIFTAAGGGGMAFLWIGGLLLVFTLLFGAPGPGRRRAEEG